MILVIIGGFLVFQPQGDKTGQVRELVEKLRSENVGERESASQRLVELGGDAVSELSKASKDSDPEVAARAGIVLRAIEVVPRLTPNIMKVLRGTEMRLARGDAHTWTEILLEVTDSGKGPLRAGLGREDLDALVGPAVGGASTDDEKLIICGLVRRERLISAGGGIIKLLGDPNPDVVDTAASTLGELGIHEAIPGIVHVLKDRKSRNFGLYAGILGDLGAKEAIPLLVESLREDFNPAVTRALEALGPGESIPLVLKMLDVEVPVVRQRAIHTLGALGAQEAAPAITRLLVDPDARIRETAVWALTQIKGSQAKADIVRLIDDRSQDVQMAVLEALAGLQADEARLPLVKMLKDASESRRKRAAQALGLLGGEDSSRALMDLLHDESEFVRINAIRSLALMGCREASREILKLLEDPDCDSTAVMALAYLGARESIPEIRRFLRNPAPAFFATTLDALEKLKDKEAAVEVRKYLSQRDIVGDSAARWLCRMGFKEGAQAVVENSSDLFCLNALRQPEAWERLTEAKVKCPMKGSLKTIVERLGKAAGLALDFGQVKSRWDEFRFSRYRELPFPPLGQHVRVHDALESIRLYYLRDYDFILESGRLRVLPHDQGIAFWKEWLLSK